MAQKQLPILNRVGLFQHWAGAWDGHSMYPLLHRQQFLLREIISEFIAHRNSVHVDLFNQEDLEEQLQEVEKLPEVKTFENLIETIRAHRRKRQRYILVGRVVFLQFQGWTTFVVFIYKPEAPNFLPEETLPEPTAYAPILTRLQTLVPRLTHYKLIF